MMILEERQCQLGSSCMIFDFWWWSDVQDWYGLESRWHSRAPRRDSMRCLATREHPLIHKVQLSVKKKKRGLPERGIGPPSWVCGVFIMRGVGRVSFNNEVYKFRFRMISDDISIASSFTRKKNCNTKNRIRFKNLVSPPPWMVDWTNLCVLWPFTIRQWPIKRRPVSWTGKIFD